MQESHVSRQLYHQAGKCIYHNELWTSSISKEIETNMHRSDVYLQFDFASTISELKWLGGREDADKVICRAIVNKVPFVISACAIYTIVYMPAAQA